MYKKYLSILGLSILIATGSAYANTKECTISPKNPGACNNIILGSNSKLTIKVEGPSNFFGAYCKKTLTSPLPGGKILGEIVGDKAKLIAGPTRAPSTVEIRNGQKVDIEIGQLVLANYNKNHSHVQQREEFLKKGEETQLTLSLNCKLCTGGFYGGC